MERGGKYTCGGSIYIGSEKGAGTLGCLVQKNGEIYGLSNNHIVGACNYAPIGLPIVIPGGIDVTAGGKDPETIGHLHCAYPLIDGIPDVVNCDHNIDAALFRVNNPDRLSSLQRNHFDTPTSILPLATGMEVEKVGRTTGLTRGTVVAENVGYTPVDCPIPIFGGRKLVYFKNMFFVQPTTLPAFSHCGDSGSLIVYTDSEGIRHAVGIVVGGTPQGMCLALSIDRVVNHFGVTLLGNHNV